MANSENIFIQMTLYRMSRQCSCIQEYMYTHMYVITMNEKRGLEFEREQGRVYGRVLRERQNDVIILFSKVK